MVEIYRKGKLVDTVKSVRLASEKTGLSVTAVKDATKDGRIKTGGYEFRQVAVGGWNKHIYTVTVIEDGIPEFYEVEGVEEVCKIVGCNYSRVRYLMNHPSGKYRITRHEG